MATRQEIKAVLFDLDGTLLPLEQDYFLKNYFEFIAKFVSEFGFDGEKFVNSTLYGTKYMLGNNGEQSNKDVFWGKFFEAYGGGVENAIEISDKFYVGDFKALREFTTENDLAKPAVDAAHRGEKKVVLATNPVFPMAAQLERISWLGLSESDFDLITSYENSSYSKPNPKYYLEICEKIGVAPENCLMIGNDESDDMKGASEAGLQCFLCTDHRIMAKHFMWQGERGTFEQALHLLERI